MAQWVRVLAQQASGPEFQSPATHKMVSIAVHAYNPSNEETEMGGSQEHANQPATPVKTRVSHSMRDPASRKHSGE